MQGMKPAAGDQVHLAPLYSGSRIEGSACDLVMAGQAQRGVAAVCPMPVRGCTSEVALIALASGGLAMAGRLADRHLPPGVLQRRVDEGAALLASSACSLAGLPPGGAPRRHAEGRVHLDLDGVTRHPGQQVDHMLRRVGWPEQTL